MARPKVYSAELRERLVQATATTIAARGPGALSLRHLAADVGTSTNAVYALFGSRDDLIQAVVDEAAQSLRAAQTEAAGEGCDLPDLEALAWAHYGWARDNPAMYGVMHGTADSPGLITHLDETTPLTQVVSTLVERGVLRSGQVPLIVTSIHACMHGLASLYINPDGQAPDDDSVRACLRATIRAWQV